MSKPQKLTRDSDGKITGGPIALEHSKGSMHVPEVPCPHCTAANGDVPTGYQQLLQENMKFGHCKNLLEEWDLTRVLNETYFECIHCHEPIEESWKRWMNDRTRRRWRRTNFAEAEPNHISFQISDFYGYDDSVRWGRLAIEYIKSKGNPEKREPPRRPGRRSPRNKNRDSRSASPARRLQTRPTSLVPARHHSLRRCRARLRQMGSARIP
jgi:hypothetical protein